jgi:hypothetical protein
MNALRILFRTNRFNLSKVGAHFINPCCFGEDLAAWLQGKLRELEIEIRPPYQEDWGWELPAKLPSGSYYLCMSGNAEESSADKDDGEWGIMVEKKRSVGQLLTGKGKIRSDDEMMRTVEEILTKEPAIREVRREQ